ncbi:polysaccharide lyase-like protein [Chitinophaga dinghuensis]|uniref:Polysaccharide lyase-like protein n=1 Tax=Chitinophaga dinghuensis TaxID=1539050 RepID=A0A327WBI2_9BACT|nr:heparin lyase I family protein [Chitinophaga dinghuensis]RAJ83468.1 polysaccharide lyase-like protein [Chitinophaga dinghuensis]
MKINQALIIGLLGISCITGLTNCTKDNSNPATAKTGNAGAHVESLLFNGDAALGSSNVWKVLNFEGSGTITVETDPTYGQVWKFYKPAASHRTEGHGAKNYQAAEGDDIYIGWRSKLSIPANQNTNAVFQWKAFGSTLPMLQNYPIVLSTSSSNTFHLMHYAPGKIGTEVWVTPLSANVWNTMVLHLKVSRDSSIGFIEFWYNGTKQTLVNGTQRYYARTLDADYCDPKWGVYGGDPADITNYVHGIKIGTTLADVDPGGGGSPAPQVLVYQNCSYGGWSASFGPGQYNTAAIVAAGGLDNDASSLKIPAGVTVTLFDGDNFTGDSLVLTSDASCLKNTSTFNDRTSSLKVKVN